MEENICYRPHLVAFMDILGFTHMIDKNSKEELENIEKKAVENIRMLLNAVGRNVIGNLDLGDFEDDDAVVKYKIFSDCICLSSDCIVGKHSNEKVNWIYSFLKDVIKIQAELLKNDWFIRGAITVGNHFQNDNLIYSDALVNAHDLEQKKAIYPRILIDESVIKILMEYDDYSGAEEVEYSYFNKIIKKSSDGLFFLDYLEYYNIKGIEPEEYFMLHKNILEEKLKKKYDNHEQENERIVKKYLWLARYHNYKVSLFTNHKLDNLKIKLDDFEFYNDTFKSLYIFLIKKDKNDGTSTFAIVKSSEENSAKEKIYRYLNIFTEGERKKIEINKSGVVKFKESAMELYNDKQYRKEYKIKDIIEIE